MNATWKFAPSVIRRCGARAVMLCLVFSRPVAADVGATGLATIVCDTATTACCGKVLFDDQTYAVLGTDYNIVQSGTPFMNGIGQRSLLLQGPFSTTWFGPNLTFGVGRPPRVRD